MSADSDGYVHRPGAITDDEGPDGATDAGVDTSEGSDAADSDGEFGPRGWLLVAVVFVGFLVVPGIIYLRPATPGEAGLPFVVAMLVLPLVPAALLGATAVWSMSSSARSGK